MRSRAIQPREGLITSTVALGDQAIDTLALLVDRRLQEELLRVLHGGGPANKRSIPLGQVRARSSVALPLFYWSAPDDAAFADDAPLADDAALAPGGQLAPGGPSLVGIGVAELVAYPTLEVAAEEARELVPDPAARMFVTVPFAPQARSVAAPSVDRWVGLHQVLLIVPEVTVWSGPDGDAVTVASIQGGVESATTLAARAKRVAGVLEDWPGSNAAGSDADGGEALVTSASGSQRTPGQPLTLPPEQRDEVRSMVVAVLEAIASGAVRKVVIATSATTKRSPSPDPARVAATLRKRRVGSFVYLLQLGASPAFVGASPERLVRVQGDIVETVALAGSAPRAADAAADREMGSALLASRKDRAEQSIVVETIRESLEPVTGELDVPPGPRLRKLQQIQHLESRIRGRLSGPQRLLDVAALLHPTPALGGMPRGEAMALIERLEGGTRGLYGGAIGWVDGAGDGDLTVGIRCLLLAGDEVTAYAGAGVVEGSDPEAELREMELKLASVLAVLDGTESSALGQDTSAQASAGPGAAPPERDTLG